MRSVVVVLAALGLLSSAHGHLGTAPGRFTAGTGGSAPPPPIPVGPPSAAATCNTSFALNGSSFDVSSLKVDVGGWVAENSVDKFSYCLNVCAVVTSERNCICYPCGADSPTSGVEYPASQVDKDPVKGETCEAYLGELKSSTWSGNADPEKPGVTLTYGDGQAGKSTELILICDQTTSGLDTGPSFVGEGAGSAGGTVFMFEWTTSAGCPLNSTRLQ